MKIKPTSNNEIETMLEAKDSPDSPLKKQIHYDSNTSSITSESHKPKNNPSITNLNHHPNFIELNNLNDDTF